MVQWINRTVVQAPRNGANTHTVAFAPASAGSLLVCVAHGAVTSSTPSGWTLPTNGSAVNNTGLYVWHRTATAGLASLTTTHNGSNYPVVFVIYEFAAGSTFEKSVAGTALAFAAANPNLTGLTGTNLTFGVVGVGAAATNTTGATAWSGGTPVAVEDVDLVAVQATTDGYVFSLGYAEGVTATSWQPTGNMTVTGTSPNKEALTFAVKAVAVSAAPVANAGPDQANIEPGTTVTLAGSGTNSPTLYAWSQTAGTAVTLSSTSAASPTFKAPANAAGETLVFSLVASNATGSSAPDTVSITVLPQLEWILVGSSWKATTATIL